MKYVLLYNCGLANEYWIEEQDVITDSDSPMPYLFESEQAANTFAAENYIPRTVVLPQIGTCSRCGEPLFPSRLEGYTSQCFACNEDFYSFEQETEAPNA